MRRPIRVGTSAALGLMLAGAVFAGYAWGYLAAGIAPPTVVQFCDQASGRLSLRL